MGQNDVKKLELRLRVQHFTYGPKNMNFAQNKDKNCVKKI